MARADTQEVINLNRNKEIPSEYTCRCKYCKGYKGMLIRKDGSVYNRNERRDYMLYKHGGGGAGHINPTPLHIARWGVQFLTAPNDWVLDPFMGCGTTAVEAINNGRNAFGTEIDSAELARTNIKTNHHEGVEAKVYKGDARKLWSIVHKHPKPALMVLHPPYSGDEQQNAKYDKAVTGNLAFMKESEAYWNTMDEIFRVGCKALKVGGFAIIGVKEMMRNKAWWDLHIQFNSLLDHVDNMQYKGMILLPHYPRTLHMNTYFKRYGVHPSYYQTVTIWKKVEL